VHKFVTVNSVDNYFTNDFFGKRRGALLGHTSSLYSFTLSVPYIFPNFQFRFSNFNLSFILLQVIKASEGQMTLTL